MATKNYEIKVDTGAINVPVKNEDGELLGEIKINPADMNIVERYEKVVDFFNEVKFDDDKEVTTEDIINLSNTIKEQIDYLFDYAVSNTLFTKCNPLTVISNGDFFFENVLESIAGLIEKITNQRIEKKMKKIKKVTDKYTTKYHK